MSLESSEIVTNMTTTLRQHLTEYHLQNINDIQVIVSRMEERLLLKLLELEERLIALEKQREVGEP